MAILLGNLALILDGRTIISPADRKSSRPVTLDHLNNLILNLPIKQAHRINYVFHNLALHNNLEAEEGGGEGKSLRRRRGKSKARGGDFDGNMDDISDELDEEGESWESRMRQRLKEMEEMKELEKKAEELQSRKVEGGGEEGEGGGGFGEEESEEEKRMRVRRELEKVAKEQAERRATAKLMFELGQKAYGRGMYSRAIEFLEGALTIIPKPTLFGGEIQIWLAMAYEANKRHADCINLYRQLEQKHPVVTIRRQASELRYILQAPKLKISQDEMVSIPLIGSSYDSDKYLSK
ncbi:hypothetical protein IFM89_002763 [Coptis chinensis]|uniref:Uncharacterized protein n=1 Tax=Coptis chinensis TaxID=261450 RepID=A0A835LQA0_9MAGN|nr:hypothetical protein IFM89_002763 [Coptis chinensis]